MIMNFRGLKKINLNIFLYIHKLIYPFFSFFHKLYSYERIYNTYNKCGFIKIYIFLKKNFFIFLFSQFVINSLLIFFVIFKNNKLINRPHNFLPKIYLSKVLIEGLDNGNK